MTTTNRFSLPPKPPNASPEIIAVTRPFPESVVASFSAQLDAELLQLEVRFARFATRKSVAASRKRLSR